MKNEKRKLILPMKFNAGTENFEPDMEKIKELGDYLKKKMPKNGK